MARYSWLLACVPGLVIGVYLLFSAPTAGVEKVLRVASVALMLISLALLTRYVVRSGQA